ncbi:MAG: response regulator transcription factor [Butyrivibrio sp.]|uniref:LytR/AlgR family response regulator transcription factor n=1 Tax=Butyrivibrio sp. TaxID=28121 RepID=UPI001B2E9762|nr:LytTR family DNA-binding domain-containing protein [Butyrivibrio sp.]MBO6239252.1 response regulator transcription factor [Butyrivibrio sp.]
MLKLAIVDDDAAYRAEIKQLLKKYEQDYGEKFMIYEYTDGDELIEHYEPVFDIILLDVEMQFMDGMTAATDIRKVDNEVIIIFITNMPQYAIKGYQVGALDYILKPISYYPFSQTMKRAIGKKNSAEKKYIIASLHGMRQKIDVSTIKYVEVLDHDLIFHTTENDINSKGSLKEVIKEIKSDIFFLCNKGYLINLEYVDEVDGNNVIIGKDTLQVSRAKKKPLIEAINNYMRRSGG